MPCHKSENPFYCIEQQNNYNLSNVITSDLHLFNTKIEAQRFAKQMMYHKGGTTFSVLNVTDLHETDYKIVFKHRYVLELHETKKKTIAKTEKNFLGFIALKKGSILTIVNTPKDALIFRTLEDANTVKVNTILEKNQLLEIKPFLSYEL